MVDKLNTLAASLLKTVERLREDAMASGFQTETPEPSETWTKPSDCHRCEGTGYILNDDEMLWQAGVCPDCVVRCGRCGGERSIWWQDERGYEFCMDCPECVPLRQVARFINKARLPVQYEMRPILPKTEEQRQVLRWVVNWVNNYQRKSSGFLLCGPKGVGKTQIAVTALRKLIEQRSGKSFLFLQARELLSDMQSAMSTPYGGYSTTIRDACKVDVLVLDELKVLRTEWQEEVIEEIITRRYQANMTTIGTTNLEEKHLGTMMSEAGERVASRIAEWMPPIEMGGPDLRRE
jgi:DNA replication protein DnaC